MKPGDDDYFKARAIKVLRDELFPELQAKFDRWAQGKPLAVQLDFLVMDATKRYKEPDILKGRT